MCRAEHELTIAYSKEENAILEAQSSALWIGGVLHQAIVLISSDVQSPGGGASPGSPFTPTPGGMPLQVSPTPGGFFTSFPHPGMFRDEIISIYFGERRSKVDTNIIECRKSKLWACKACYSLDMSKDFNPCKLISHQEFFHTQVSTRMFG
jgi:hypothetical protein